jgi:hypothetical protein
MECHRSTCSSCVLEQHVGTSELCHWSHRWSAILFTKALWSKPCRSGHTLLPSPRHTEPLTSMRLAVALPMLLCHPLLSLQEWEAPQPSKRPDIFPEFEKPERVFLPKPLPGETTHTQCQHTQCCCLDVTAGLHLG